jgi:hypothetical protein
MVSFIIPSIWVMSNKVSYTRMTHKSNFSNVIQENDICYWDFKQCSVLCIIFHREILMTRPTLAEMKCPLATLLTWAIQCFAFCYHSLNSGSLLWLNLCAKFWAKFNCSWFQCNRFYFTIFSECRPPIKSTSMHFKIHWNWDLLTPISDW